MPLFLRCFVALLLSSLLPVAAASVWLSLRHLLLLEAAAVLGAAAGAAWLTQYIRSHAAAGDAELRLERGRVEALVQGIPDGIVMANLRGEVLYINEPAMSALGVRPEQVVPASTGLFELVRQDQLRVSLQRILEKHSLAEIVDLPAQGGESQGARYYQTSIRVYDEADGPGVGILMTLRDVTAERLMDQMKEEFFHTAAHDLRAPIYAIQGYLRLLEKSIEPDGRTRGYFGAINQSCDKLIRFIQDTLDTYRLEAGQLRLSPVPIDAAPFMRRVCDQFAPVAAEKGVAIELKSLDAELGNIEADERLLERVFNNLVANALKFSPRGGAISISATTAGENELQFAVKDDGPGIPREKLAAIFEKFAQAPEGREKGGFGLGLNICRKIIEAHHGRIWAESEPGKGADFVLRIPRTQPKSSS